MMNKPTLKLLSSLDKVFADAEPTSSACQDVTILQNEAFSFQAAYTGGVTDENHYLAANVFLDCTPEDRSRVTVRQVGLVPSELPCYADHDDNYLRTEPGLFPDSLLPLDNPVRVLDNQWRALWVEFAPDDGTAPGKHSFTLRLEDSTTGEALGEVTQTVEVLPYALPDQKLIHTEWFHSDCLCDYYHVPAFSEEHWKLLEAYIADAVHRGVNCILTPVVTPPLDTAVGGERTTVQLIDVKVVDGEYRIGLSKVIRWMQMCRRVGVEYLEICHLFTQWGAACTPKVMAEVDGEERRIFGWDVPAQSEEYKKFLSALLPKLTMALREGWGADKVFFHVSDEPHLKHLENYKAAKALITPYLTGFTIVDALSDYDFYLTGAVTSPVPSTDHIRPFLENKVPDLWTYYCCGQGVKVANRFMSMPSARNRILAYQLYLYNIKGFLQWGFNFWNTQFSKKHISPYAVTDAGLAFPSGDAFMVYPGEDGKPVESIRLLVFHQALQDLRAMELLESLTDRKTVENIINEALDAPITFDSYPKEAQWLFAVRAKINEAIRKAAE